jgi:oligogalacturonide lyase
MKIRLLTASALLLCSSAFLSTEAFAQMGKRFPSERKIVVDPVTGLPLTFVTSTQAGDSKIYQTHPQWTADGKWLIFRSNRARGQAMAVNEQTGDLIQVTEKGFMGMLCIAQKSMKLYHMRDAGAKGDMGEGPAHLEPPKSKADPKAGPAPVPASDEKIIPAGARTAPQPPRREPVGPIEIVEVNLETLFADSLAGTLKPASAYERVCGVLPNSLRSGGDMALDANEGFAYFRVSGEGVGDKLPAGTKIEGNYGPRNMGKGPAGLRSINLKTGEIGFVVDVPFQIGHVQTNPWVPGEIVFCWETGGKAPQRTWVVNASDPSTLRPLYAEASYDWVTHEAIITKDEVAIAILGHRPIGNKDEWGECGSRDHATGLGIVNLRTREIRIAGQTPSGSGYWHVNGSPDGRWAVGDDFNRSLYLIDRHTGETIMLTTGHKTTAADHIHPTFSADSTRIEIQSAMLSADNRSMNICIVPVPESWLKRTYSDKIAQ